MPRIPKSSGRIARRVKSPRISRPCSGLPAEDSVYKQASLVYCFATKAAGYVPRREPLRSLFTYDNLTGIQKAWLGALFSVLKAAKFRNGELTLSDEQRKLVDGAMLDGFDSEFNHLLLSPEIKAYIQFLRVDPSKALSEEEFKETYYEEFFDLLGVFQRPTFTELVGQ